MRKILLVLIGVIVAIPLYVYLTNPLIVTVNGTGEVNAKPDSATVAFIVAIQKETSDSARLEAESKSRALESILIGFGAQKADIAKSQITVAPSGLADPSKAYTATISMGGKIKNYAQAGAMVTSLYQNGAFYVSQPVLAADNLSALEDEAYEKAIKNAAEEAVRIGRKNRKLIRKRISIVQQLSSGGVGSVTSQGDTKTAVAVPDTLKVIKAISVTYKMW